MWHLTVVGILAACSNAVRYLSDSSIVAGRVLLLRYRFLILHFIQYDFCWMQDSFHALLFQLIVVQHHRRI